MGRYMPLVVCLVWNVFSMTIWIPLSAATAIPVVLPPPARTPADTRNAASDEKNNAAKESDRGPKDLPYLSQIMYTAIDIVACVNIKYRISSVLSPFSMISARSVAQNETAMIMEEISLGVTSSKIAILNMALVM